MQDSGAGKDKQSSKGDSWWSAVLDHYFSEYEGHDWLSHFQILLKENQFEKTNPLETRLFKDYLLTIPNGFPVDLESIAYVFYGFDEFAQKGATRYLGSLNASFEQQNLFRGTPNPGNLASKAWQLFTHARNVENISDMPSLYKEAGEIKLHGPQLFNKAMYLKLFGNPRHPWGAYNPGWQPPKVKKDR
jgi:hypothetical protein